MLAAEHGDSLLVRWGTKAKEHRILVDGGIGTGKGLERKLTKLGMPVKLELLVATHIDNDHILGLRKLFEAFPDAVAPKRVWFNARAQIEEFNDRAAAPDGDRLMQLLEDHLADEWDDDAVVVRPTGKLPTLKLADGMLLTVLSPQPDQLRKLAKAWLSLKVTKLADDRAGHGDKKLRLSATNTIDKLAVAPFKKDGSVPNGSSIAFLLEYKGKRLLCGADAYAGVLEESLGRLAKERGEKRMKLDAFKLPHHGSEGNLSVDLLTSIDCSRFLVSTDGGNGFDHPDDVAIARVIKNAKKPQLIFNYRTKRNEHWDDAKLKKAHGYTTEYASDGVSGITVKL